MPDFTASDGSHIGYRDEGCGRPIMLLHGLMAHKGFFDKQNCLASDFRLIAVDLRGHGVSHGGERPNVARIAADIAELSSALDLRSAIVVGWSLGASILWRLLSGPASPRFTGAVVVDMTPRVLNDDGWTLGLSAEHCEARSHAIREDFATFAAAAGAAIFAQPKGPAPHPLASWASDQFARNDPQAIGALWASLVEEDFRPLLGDIEQPTLIVHGSESHLYGAATADHLVEALPNARAIAFARSGHSPHLEEPELFNAMLRNFANSLPQYRQHAATA